MPDIEFAAVGDNCIDRFLPPADECLVGGNALNVAVQLAMLGRRVQYFGAVGDDLWAEPVRRALERNGVGTGGLRIAPGQCTAYTDIEMSEEGERTFVYEEFGACALYKPDAADIVALRRLRHVHIGWLNDSSGLKQALSGSGACVSQDLSVNNIPANVTPDGLDIAFCSALPGAAEDEARRLLQQGAKLAVVTLGAAGSLASNGRLTLKAPAPLITPEDTTGAGDAFIAGFLDAHATGHDLDECLRLGSECAAAACLYRGGFPQQPLGRFTDTP